MSAYRPIAYLLVFEAVKIICLATTSLPARFIDDAHCPDLRPLKRERAFHADLVCNGPSGVTSNLTS